VYRWLIYDYVILWLKDIIERDNYRRWLGHRYRIQVGRYWSPACSVRAQKLYSQIGHKNERLQFDATRTRAGGIHMLYQAGLLALPFALITFRKDWMLAIFFSGLASILLVTAILADSNYEEEELLFLKSSPAAADTVAAQLGYERQA
ncbi:MAG: hypothetical protein ACRECO_13850, partial [Xanthobacteraceae bacterium]